jgi:hypothetical protein
MASAKGMGGATRVILVIFFSFSLLELCRKTSSG